MDDDVLFRMKYKCPYDGHEWEMEWDCACNDRCPVCNKEIEPLSYDELDRTFRFHMVLQGLGSSKQDAWENMLEHFFEDPGFPPETKMPDNPNKDTDYYEIVDEEDE